MTHPAAADTCPHAANCPLFPLFRTGTNLDVWKARYCNGEFTTCERFKLNARCRNAPFNLLPNGDQLPWQGGRTT